MTRAPASITPATCSPSRAKSAERIEGATRSSLIISARIGRKLAKRAEGRGQAGRPALPSALPPLPSVLLLSPVLSRRLPVLRRRVLRLRCLADHLLAAALRLLRRRVGDHVHEVQQLLVGAGAAADPFGLAVTRAQDVVAVAAHERVARRVRAAGGVDVGARERPQPV